MIDKAGIQIVAALLTALVSSTVLAQNNATASRNSDIENIGHRDINRHDINFLSYNKEIEMGRTLANEFETGVKLLDDRVVSDYVGRLTQLIANNSDVKVPIIVKVVQADEINAFALPGGFLYINTGLILAAQNEAGFASVISHGIAQVAARQVTEFRIQEATLEYLTNQPGCAFTDMPPGAFTFIEPAGQQAAETTPPAQIVFLSFLRKGVVEADYLGIQYLYKAGYDPTAAITFLQSVGNLQTVTSDETATTSLSQSTHPAIFDRIELLKGTAGSLLSARNHYLAPTAEFGLIQARLVGRNQADIRNSQQRR